MKALVTPSVSASDLAQQYAELARKNAELAREKAELAREKAASDQLVIELSAKLRWYEEQYRLSKYFRHAASSEHSHSQQSLIFNELEVNADIPEPEPDAQETKVKHRKSKGQREPLLEGLPVETINYELPESDQICSCCNGPLHRMSEEVRQEIKIVPAVISVVKHVRGVYSCRQCEQTEIATPIVTAPAPISAFPNSRASSTAVAYLMDQKFVMGLPLYRLEQSFQRLGIPLSRQTMSNWMLKGAEWLLPMRDRMKFHLLNQPILHADETTVQVLREEGRKAETNSYMWLYRSGRDGPPIVLFEYQTTRAGLHPREFLKDFSGFLHVDGYAGYDTIPNISLVGCWAHARRNFIEAVAVIPASARRANSPTLAEQGLSFCDKLFAIEHEHPAENANDRLAIRQEYSKPLLDAFKTWLGTAKSVGLRKNATSKAITYCLNQWQKLTAFLSDGRLELDNNRSERSIKNFVIGRKNWLFSNTPRGAKASAAIYSIIETAKENNLNPAAYLTYLFDELPKINPNNPVELDKLMPWAQTLPDSCRLPKP